MGRTHFGPVPPASTDPDKVKELKRLLDKRASLEAEVIDLTSKIRDLMEDVK